jgi:tryptophan synthase beta chain
MKKGMYFLDQEDMPTHWYNIMADMPGDMPRLLHPGTGKPVTVDEVAGIFSRACAEQELNRTDRWIEIPEELLDVYRTWRPTVLHRAYRLEKALNTPAKIFYKYEGTSQAGSHKPNTATAQAYYAKKQGLKGLCTETGAGQWGSALSMGCAFFDIECKVFMVRISYDQKPYRRILMETYGANCVPSPSQETEVGRAMLGKWPDCPGSLGLAISEAIQYMIGHEGYRYSLGSVVNHVLLHQTIIGEECRKQMEMADAYPDIIVGNIGGGSNFAGQFFPWIRDKISGRNQICALSVVSRKAVPA